ncbi:MULTISPECIES: Nif3-like dinuclear metal center hexameric protein [Synergistales]|uniref:Nif3-like dinuclear metal center hexameric protein n=1 Tax=Synergistales TaxID=649776 RepID=UPI002368809B|nr:Nif3-like dinuclear metal center hexameric protein [Aminithiophilus ramosus]
MEKIKIQDILDALDRITGGRLVKAPRDLSGNNPFVVTKSSGIPGKAVTELPGLVWGDPEAEVTRAAVMMTLTESAIELAAASGVNCLVAHHPVADGTNSGGVPIRHYMDLYGLNIIELHEAFHGLHPGIAWLHGHRAVEVDIRCGGLAGNILYVGEALPEVQTLGDLLGRLRRLMDMEREEACVREERRFRGCDDLFEASTTAAPAIVVGSPADRVRKVLHIFPHTGFTPDHLECVFGRHPDADTLLASISHLHAGNALIERARELGLRVLCGNSHALEIFENGVPLARALAMILPQLEIRLFRDRMVSYPLDAFGGEAIQEYGKEIAHRHLVRETVPCGL